MSEDNIIEFLTSKYSAPGGARVKWKPALGEDDHGGVPEDEEMAYFDEFSTDLDDFEDDAASHHRHGYSYATTNRRPRFQRMNNVMNVTPDDYWDSVNDAPRFHKVVWGSNAYQLPRPPPISAAADRKQIALTITIQRLQQSGAAGTMRERYEALKAHFPFAGDLTSIVEQRTTKFHDITSSAYVFTEVVILNKNFNEITLPDPLTMYYRQNTKFVMATVRSQTDQVVAPNTIRNLPATTVAMNFIIRIPHDNNRIHDTLNDHQMLHNPKALIDAIRQLDPNISGGEAHIGFKHGETINTESFLRWQDNVTAKVDFAVMESLLYRDYVGTVSTSSPE
jgi:hypothetical protein